MLCVSRNSLRCSVQSAKRTGKCCFLPPFGGNVHGIPTRLMLRSSRSKQREADWSACMSAVISNKNQKRDPFSPIYMRTADFGLKFMLLHLFRSLWGFFQVVGSQARILYSDQNGRIAIALAFNSAVAAGKIKVRSPGEYVYMYIRMLRPKPSSFVRLRWPDPHAKNNAFF